MTQNIHVQRWLFKMDSEHGGRGTAYCDTCHLSCYNWALQERHRCGPELQNTEWIQVKMTLGGLGHFIHLLLCNVVLNLLEFWFEFLFSSIITLLLYPVFMAPPKHWFLEKCNANQLYCY